MRKKEEIVPSALIPLCENPSPPMLIGEISRLHHAVMRRKESDGIMSQDGCRLVMRALAFKDGITQKEIVKLTHLTPPTISIILTKMECAGYVSRETDKEDLRAVRVYLTESGRSFHNAKISRLKKTDAEMMKTIDDADAEKLRELLTVIRDNLLGELNK